MNTFGSLKEYTFGSRGPLRGTTASSPFTLSSPTLVPALLSEDFLALDPSFLVLSPKYVKGFGLRHAALQLLLVWLDPAPRREKAQEDRRKFGELEEELP